MSTPKTRWRDAPAIRITSSQEMAAQATCRMDVDYYRAKDTLIKILDGLTHQSHPTIEGFMENIDFMLDHQNLINAAKQTWAAAQAEANPQVK